MLQQLKVPYHEAPGEAEAECAKLQVLGVVDAVWSDDGDALMFGCRTLIRQHKSGSERVKDYIRVYEASVLQDEYGLDVDGLVLFAVLAGGDYDTTGLKDCGSRTAHRLAKPHIGLAKALANTSEAMLPSWRAMLQDKLLQLHKAIEVPQGFPMWRALNYYRNPTVSAQDQLLDLRGLRHGWDRPIDQIELRSFLRERFHFTTREFLKHIAPIFVTRRLARAHADQREANMELGILLKRTRKKNDTGNTGERAEAKVIFSPLAVVDIDLSQRPDGEDWTKFTAKYGTPYDPTQSVDGEILCCFLKHGLPDGALEEAKPARRKRKTTEDGESSANASSSKKRKTTPPLGDVQDGCVESHQTARPEKECSTFPKKRGRTKKQPPTATVDALSTSKDDNDQNAPSSSGAPVFRQAQGLLDLRATIIDLCDEDETSVQLEQTAMSVSATAKPPMRPRVSPEIPFAAPAWSSRTESSQLDKSADRLVPGETISPKMLRGLRAAAFLTKGPGRQRSQSSMESAPPSLPNKSVEVIDLTCSN